MTDVEANIPKPEMVALTPADELFLRDFDQNIQRRPEHYFNVLQRLGPAVAQTDMTTQEARADTSTPNRQNAAHAIAFYFNKRKDRGGFDDATEAAIADAPDLAEALVKQATMTKVLVSTGVMRKQLRENPDANQVRDQIRYGRLAVYILRAAEWQEPDQADNGQLPSAS